MGAKKMGTYTQAIEEYLSAKSTQPWRERFLLWSESPTPWDVNLYIIDKWIGDINAHDRKTAPFTKSWLKPLNLLLWPINRVHQTFSRVASYSHHNSIEQKRAIVCALYTYWEHHPDKRPDLTEHPIAYNFPWRNQVFKVSRFSRVRTALRALQPNWWQRTKARLKRWLSPFSKNENTAEPHPFSQPAKALHNESVMPLSALQDNSHLSERETSVRGTSSHSLDSRPTSPEQTAQVAGETGDTAAMVSQDNVHTMDHWPELTAEVRERAWRQLVEKCPKTYQHWDEGYFIPPEIKEKMMLGYTLSKEEMDAWYQAELHELEREVSKLSHSSYADLSRAMNLLQIEASAKEKIERFWSQDIPQAERQTMQRELQKIVRKAYLKASRHHHPDKGGTDEMQQQVGEARATLASYLIADRSCEDRTDIYAKAFADYKVLLKEEIEFKAERLKTYLSAELLSIYMDIDREAARESHQKIMQGWQDIKEMMHEKFDTLTREKIIPLREQIDRDSKIFEAQIKVLMECFRQPAPNAKKDLPQTPKNSQSLPFAGAMMTSEERPVQPKGSSHVTAPSATF